MPAESTDTAPRETVYVNNLNDRINVEEVKKSLYGAFSQFGPILDVVALRTYRMRGQAFIVFRDISSATQAVRQMQGFPFYDKPMRLTYAKTKSDASSKLDGTYELKQKQERQAKRKAEREAREKEAKRPAKAAAEPADEVIASSSSMPPADMPAPGGAMAAPPPAIPPPSAQPTVAMPNPILFIENLPEAVNDMMLSMLFQQFPGYKEVRLVPVKP